MNTNARHTLSATGLGLLSFTLTSVLVSGLFATPTVIGFALLAVYGIAEIATLSYATPRTFAPRAEPGAARIVAARITAAGTVVAFPTIVARGCHARAA